MKRSTPFDPDAHREVIEAAYKRLATKSTTQEISRRPRRVVALCAAIVIRVAALARSACALQG